MFSSIESKYIDFKIVTVLLKMYVEEHAKRQVYKNDYVEYVYHHRLGSISYQATMAQEPKFFTRKGVSVLTREILV